jgi:hypothetical protein
MVNATRLVPAALLLMPLACSACRQEPAESIGSGLIVDPCNAKEVASLVHALGERRCAEQ